ncbi:hypothetical protein D3C85_1809540 [compost metagenome]
MSRRFDEDVQHAFAEDRAVLAAVHKGMIHPRTPPINLPSDVGPVKFRRELAKRIAAEGAQQLHAVGADEILTLAAGTH